MNLLRRFFRRRYLSDTGLPVGDPETGSEDVWTRELLAVPVRGASAATDADKLRALADWLDRGDDRRGFEGEREVQADLRRIADGLAA